MQYISIEGCGQRAPVGVRLTYVGKQSRNAQSKVNALMLPPLRLYSKYPLKLPACCSFPLCSASHSALPTLAADYCERLTE